jgi:putative membrane protein
MAGRGRGTRLIAVAGAALVLAAAAACSDDEGAARPTISPSVTTADVTGTTTVETTTVDTTVTEATGTTTVTTTPPDGTTVTAGTTVQMDDAPPDVEAWLITVHQQNLARLAAGRSAESVAASGDVRALGGRWVTDYPALDAEVRARAAARGVALPDTPTPGSDADLDAVERESGDGYDAAWTARETGDISTYLAFVEDGGGAAQDPDVVALAAMTRPVLREHLDLLAGIRRPVEAVPAGEGPVGGPGRVGAVAVAAVGAALVLVAGVGAAVARRRP